MLKLCSFFIFSGLFLTSEPFTNTTSFPISQDWSNTAAITMNDDWSGVVSIQGFLGDDASTTATGVDPQTILVDNSTIDVIANQTSTSITNGGVAEFHISNPSVALQPSGTADYPNLVIYANTISVSGVRVQYKLRDLDASADNAVQPVALQYRVGNSGNFTNVPAGFVPDATTGPGLAVLETNIDVLLPAACDNQPEVQIRIITSNAAGNDEWVGIDDILIFEQLILPVTLLNFSGYRVGDINRLQWTTATEVNNQGFEVQRSVDGFNFNPIGFLNSQGLNGISMAQLRYSFDDPHGSLNQFYRLRQVDISGFNKFSHVIHIREINSATTRIHSIFPNPAHKQLTIQVGATSKNEFMLSVLDITGKLVLYRRVRVENGNNAILLDIGHFRKGNYILKLSDRDGFEIARFFKL